jgi:hypothetical protein
MRKLKEISEVLEVLGLGDMKYYSDDESHMESLNETMKAIEACRTNLNKLEALVLADKEELEYFMKSKGI